MTKNALRPPHPNIGFLSCAAGLWPERFVQSRVSVVFSF
jgi:hypothetical protein